MRRVTRPCVPQVRRQCTSISLLERKQQNFIFQKPNQITLHPYSKVYQHTAATIQDTGASSIFTDVASEESNKKKKRRTDRNALKRYLKQQEAEWPTAKAKVNNLHISPKKLNRVCRFIRGLSAKEAMGQLLFLNKGCADDVSKCLRAAMFNAENNFGMNSDRLIVKEAYVGKGKYLKRMRYHGRARFGIMKRYRAHLRIIVQEVPEQENERRLGRAGWTNETWRRREERAEQIQLQEQTEKEESKPEQKEEQQQEEQQQEEQESVSSAASSSAMGAAGGIQSEIPNPQMAQSFTDKYSPSVDEMLKSVKDVEAEIEKDETQQSQTKTSEESEEKSDEQYSANKNTTEEEHIRDEEAEVVESKEENKKE